MVLNFSRKLHEKLSTSFIRHESYLLTSSIRNDTNGQALSVLTLSMHLSIVSAILHFDFQVSLQSTTTSSGFCSDVSCASPCRRCYCHNSGFSLLLHLYLFLQCLFGVYSFVAISIFVLECSGSLELLLFTFFIWLVTLNALSTPTFLNYLMPCLWPAVPGVCSGYLLIFK